MRRVHLSNRFLGLRLGRATPVIVEVAMTIAVASTAGLLLDLIERGAARGAALSPAHYATSVSAPLA